MGAPITLSIILPCGEAVEHLRTCLDQFSDWRPHPELICVVPADQPALAQSLAAHPAEPFVMTATGARAALLAAGVAEAQGSVVLLLDPATRLGADTHRAIFRTLARTEQAAGFFRIAAKDNPAEKALADPVAVSFSGVMHAPLGPGAFFCRTQSLKAAGGVPTDDTLLDYRLARRLGQQTTVVALHEQVESLRDGHPDSWHLIWQVIRLATGAPLASLAPDATPSALPVVAAPPPPPKTVTIVEPPTMMILTPVILTEPKQVDLEPGEFTVQVESHLEPDSEAAPVVAIKTEVVAPITAPPIELPNATPIITAGQTGFDALFAEASHDNEQPPEPATVWEKMNAAFHRILFHDAAGPNTPVPGTLPSIDLARIRAAEAAAQAEPGDGAPRTSGSEKNANGPSANAVVPTPAEITFDWTPHPTGGLRGDPRIPWSRAPVDPGDADPFTAAELSQVRRAFTDLLHPSPIEAVARPAGRIIELAITPPELKERREKQEGE